MRGQAKNTKKLIITGKVFDEFEIQNKSLLLTTGDMTLYITIESQIQIEATDYNFYGYKGFFKAKIFDGKAWNHIFLDEFLDERENRFGRSEYIMPYFLQTKEVIESSAGKTMYKTYRDHYTLREYIPGIYKGKKGHFDQKKKPKA